MKTHFKKSLVLASSLFISSNVYAHCNQLAVFGPQNTKTMEIKSYQYLRYPDAKPFGNVLILERTPWWNGGGTDDPLQAEILITREDGSTMKVKVDQGYCDWWRNKIAKVDGSVLEEKPLQRDRGKPPAIPASDVNSAGRIYFN